MTTLPSINQADGTRSATTSVPTNTGEDTSPWRQRFSVLHETLRERITLLTYPPGTRLDLDQLAREFNVSRTPIRNVLQRLERDGLVNTRHGVGTMVADVDFGEVREATILRTHIAEMIGSINPQPPDQQALEIMETLPARIRSILKHPDQEEYVRIDLHLHQCLSSLIGSALFLRLYDELFFRTVRMWFTILPLMDWETEVNSFTDHIVLTQGAMRRGDLRSVGLISRNAISAGMFRVDELLGKTLAADPSAN